MGETKEPGEGTSWQSIYIASALSFVGAVQFSLFFSSLWPYLQIIDDGITESFFGYIISIYSFGQILAAPSFGYWSNRLRAVKLPLQVGLFLMLVGNVLYILMGAVPLAPRFLLLFGRFITGSGSGNSSLLRAYASTASTPRDRSKAIAYVTCGQAFGQVAGPAFQLLFTPLAYPGIHLIGPIRLNMYTAPAFAACFANAIGSVALAFLFKENFAGVDSKALKSSKKNGTVDDPEAADKAPIIPPYDLLAVFICYLTRFTQMFAQGNLETIGSVFSMDMFGWDEAKTVTITSAAQGVVGLMTLGFYVIYIVFRIEDRLNLRVSNIAALLALVLFHLLTYAWPFLPKTPRPIDPESGFGCDPQKFQWCNNLSQVNMWVYYSAYALCIGLSFPSLNITLATLFSYILGPRLQGTEQGMLQTFGGIARMVGPILISTLYSMYGPTMAWNMQILVLIITTILWLVFYKRMIPIEKRIEQNSTWQDGNNTITNLSTSELTNLQITNATDQLSRTSSSLDLNVPPSSAPIQNGGPNPSTIFSDNNDTNVMHRKGTFCGAQSNYGTL